MNILRRTAQRTFIILSVAVFFGGLLTAILSPHLTNTAYATNDAPSVFNTIRNRHFPGVLQPVEGPLQACSGRIDRNSTLTVQMLRDNFWPGIDELIPYRNNRNDVKSISPFMYTKWGEFVPGDNDEHLDIVMYLLNSIDKPTSIIRFYTNTSATAVNPPNQTGGGSAVCDSLTMLQVGANRFMGVQATSGPGSGNEGAEIGARMTFVPNASDTSGSNTAGTFVYYDYSPRGNNQFPGVTENRRTANNFVMQGRMGTGSGSGGSGVPGLQASWMDAGHIRITGGVRSGEVYEKRVWDDVEVKTTGGQTFYWSLYFLSDPGSGPSANSRAQQVWDTGRGCRNPVTLIENDGTPVSACNALNGEPGNCVPFIAVQQRINLNTSGGNPNTSQLQNRIDSLGNAPTKFYDYESNCALRGHSPPQRNLGNQTNAKIWFYHSSESQAIATVFPSGAGNEQPFTGTYLESRRAGERVTFEGGRNGCDGEATVNLVASSVYPTTWELRSGNCGALFSYGTVGVLTLGGDAGEAGFSRVSNLLPPVDLPEGDDFERVGCSWFENPLSWMICPFVLASLGAIQWLDSTINDMLNINVSNIFDDSQDSGQAYHRAWGVFRTFALAIIVIAALIMVIAQAAGIEILDAYTIRKILPRLLMAAIGITFSWQLGHLGVVISNELGQGIRGIIYAPFSGLESIQELGFGTNVIIILLTAGAILAMGIIAMLSFVVTGLIAVLMAFAALTFREIAIIALVMLSPIAMACAILPNTQKVWQFWRKGFIGLLASYVIIMAIVAVGRVFSATAASAGGTMSEIVAIIAYFAPYFLLLSIITFSFNMAGAAFGAVANMAGQASKRLGAPLSSYRANTRKERFKRGVQRVQSGKAFGTGNAFNRSLSRAAQYASALPAAGVGGVFRPRRVGAARVQNAITQRSKAGLKAAQEDADFDVIKDNDILLGAGLHSRRESDIRAFLARSKKDGGLGATGEVLEKNVQAVMAAQRSLGANFEGAAVVAKAGTGSGYSDRDAQGRLIGHGLMHQDILKAAGGDRNLEESLLAQARSAAGNARRYDLSTPGFGANLGVMEDLRAGRIDAAEASRRMRAVAVQQGGAGAALGGRNESAEAFAAGWQERLQTAHEAVATARTPGAREAAVRRLTQDFASAEAMIDTAGQAPPAVARIFADGVHQGEFDLTQLPPDMRDRLGAVYEPTVDAAGNAVRREVRDAAGNIMGYEPVMEHVATRTRIPVREMMERLQGIPEYRTFYDQMRRNYGSQYQAETAQRAAAAGGPATAPAATIPTGPARP